MVCRAMAPGRGLDAQQTSQTGANRSQHCQYNNYGTLGPPPLLQIKVACRNLRRNMPLAECYYLPSAYVTPVFNCKSYQCIEGGL